MKSKHYELNRNRLFEGTEKYTRIAMVDILSSCKLVRGVDYEFEKDGLCVSIFWHEPSLNLSWYPIIQIDLHDKIIFHREGYENEDYYSEILNEAIEFLSEEKGD